MHIDLIWNDCKAFSMSFHIVLVYIHDMWDLTWWFIPILSEKSLKFEYFAITWIDSGMIHVILCYKYKIEQNMQ